MTGKAIAFDPGSHSWKILACKEGKTGLAVTRFAVAHPRDGTAGLVAAGIPLQAAVVGLSGREMTLRYTQVPPAPDWQLRNLMDLEIQDIAEQSGGELSADYNLLPAAEDAEMDTVLMALARNDALARIDEVLIGAKGSVAAHVPNCVALFNAYQRTAVIDDEDQVVCLANIGRDTTDIALVKGRDLLFARNLTTGTRVLDDAIAGAFDVSARKAESLKHDLIDLDPSSRGRYASGMAEKVTLAAGGAAGSFTSAIQSSLAFCQSQTKIQGLQLDRVLLTGGGARLRGLRGMLRESLRCPVEEFDPFAAVDLSALPEQEAEALRQYRSEAVVALGLAVGRLDEAAYSLEILPEAVKRRQRFMRRTIFNIAAGLIGVVLLVLTATRSQQELAALSTIDVRLQRQRSTVKGTHEAAEKLIEQNALDSEVTRALGERSIPLHGVVRTLRALYSGNLVAPEMWITSVGMQKGRQGRRDDSGPLVEMRGAIRPISGRDVGEVYREFLKNFREHELIAGAEVVARVDDQSEEKTVFTITIDFAPQTESKSGQEGG